MGMIIRYFSIKKVKLFNRVADPRPFQVGLLFKYRCQIRFRLSGPAAKVKQIKSRSWPKKLQSAVKKQSTILVLKNDKEKRKLIKVCFAAGSGDDQKCRLRNTTFYQEDEHKKSIFYDRITKQNFIFQEGRSRKLISPAAHQASNNTVFLQPSTKTYYQNPIKPQWLSNGNILNLKNLFREPDSLVLCSISSHVQQQPHQRILPGSTTQILLKLAIATN